MNNGIDIRKETLEIINTNTNIEESDSDSELYTSRSLTNELNFTIEDTTPLPCHKNLLDNYDFIQYKNIKFPRIKNLEINNLHHYKNIFTQFFIKINQDYLLTKLLVDKISQIPYNKQSKKEKIKTSNDNNKKENNTNIEKTKELNKPKYIRRIFNLKLYDKNKNLINKKRGRRSLKVNLSHVHSALDDDNILRKIQVHFLTFLVSFTNDYINALFPNMDKKNLLYFRHIDYKLKKTINHNSIEKIKKLKIGEILQRDASPKNKTCGSNINKIIYNKLCEKCPNLKYNYFNKIFKEFFIEYYYNKKERFILINGVKVILSNKTNTFNDLIQKNIQFNLKFRQIASYFYTNSILEDKNNKKKYEEDNGVKEKNMEKNTFFVINK